MNRIWLFSITSMQGGGGKRDQMTAGGLCGFGTLLDPSITTADNLSGQVLAKKGELPEIRTECAIEINLMKNMVAGDGEQPDTIHPLRNNEMLMVNVATSTSVGIVKGVEKGKANQQRRPRSACFPLPKSWSPLAAHRPWDHSVLSLIHI